MLCWSVHVWKGMLTRQQQGGLGRRGVCTPGWGSQQCPLQGGLVSNLKKIGPFRHCILTTVWSEAHVITHGPLAFKALYDITKG